MPTTRRSQNAQPQKSETPLPSIQETYYTFTFFRPDHLSDICDIVIPLTYLDGTVKESQPLFARKLSEKYRFKADESSVELWLPKNPPLLDAVQSKQWTDPTDTRIRTLASPVPGEMSLKSVLESAIKKTKGEEKLHFIVTANSQISCNVFFFDPQHSHRRVFSIDIPPSLLDKAQYCQEVCSRKILETFGFVADTPSVEFWRPQKSINTANISIDPNSDLRTFATFVPLTSSLEKAIGNVAEDDEGEERLHFIVTAKSQISCNFFFFDPQHPHYRVFSIDIPRSLFKDKAQRCQEVFSRKILETFGFVAETPSVEFWRPQKSINTANISIDPNSDLQTFATFVPFTDSLEEGVDGLITNNKIVHIIVVAHGHYKTNEQPNQTHELPESERYDLLYSTTGFPPSEGAKSTNYPAVQNDPGQVIHDGRYPHDAKILPIAPPIQIFHPIFNKFLRAIEDPALQPTNEDLKDTLEFMRYMSKLAEYNEAMRNSKIRSRLSKILQRDVIAESNPDNTTPDGVIQIRILGVCIAICLILELKKELGDGGSDPSTQAGITMRRTWRFSPVGRDKCCCPTFILAGGGAWMGVLGGVLTDKMIVQRLTDLRWMGVSSTEEETRIHNNARILVALRECLKSLKTFYEKELDEIPPFVKGKPHPRYFPYPNSFKDETGTTRFRYLRALEDDPQCVTYLAELIKNDHQNRAPDKIVVKFVARYSEEAHRLLAEQGHAPKLLYYGNLPDTSKLSMVVMEYVDTKPTLNIPRNARPQIETILTTLHSNGYVFGDLRNPNILITADNRIQLIDFNWAGRYDVASEMKGKGLSKVVRKAILQKKITAKGPYVHYPLTLSTAISWARGVEALSPIRPKHDWEMLEKLVWK